LPLRPEPNINPDMSNRHRTATALMMCSLGISLASCKGDGGGSVPAGTELALVYAGNNIGEIEPCG